MMLKICYGERLLLEEVIIWKYGEVGDWCLGAVREMPNDWELEWVEALLRKLTEM